jgi:hypothetical protein
VTEEVPRPALRARWTQVLFDMVDRLTPDEQASFEERVGRTKMEYLRGSDSLAWVPIEDHLHVLQSLYDLVGPREFVAYVRSAGGDALRSPFLRTVAVTGVKVFGRAALLRVLPRAWRLSMRSCGRLIVERDADQGTSRIIIREMPKQLEGNTQWRLAFAATLASTLDLGGYIGSVRVDEGTYADGELRYVVSLVVEPDDDPGEGEGGVAQSQS